MAHDSPNAIQHTAHADDHPNNVQPSRGFIALPAETIHHVLHFLHDPRDLFHVQAVSKRCNAIASDPVVWRTAYATARLPLPPGPFSRHSTRFLQRALVVSARLARTWTTERPAVLSTQLYIGPRASEEDRYRWVGGRWLIMSSGMRHLRVRDVETGAEGPVWDGAPYAGWAATSVMHALGHFIYVAVHLRRGRLEDPVKLVEFVVNDDTGRLSVSDRIDVPIWCLVKEAFTPCIRADSGVAPYAYISLCPANHPRHSFVFDPRSREFYKFPRFQTQLDILLNYRGKWLPRLVGVYFTRTHLFVFSRAYLIHGNLGDIELIQTFALPDVPDSHPGASHTDSDDNSGFRQPVIRELRLTHETYTRQKSYTWDVQEPLRDATVDSEGSITLRFMHTYSPFYPSPDMYVRLVCADYILPAYPGSTRPGRSVVPVSVDEATTMTTTSPDLGAFHTIVQCPDPVLPITFQSHEIVSIPGKWRGGLLHVSASGFLRGLCLLGWYTPAGDASARKALEVVHKLSIDATGERCIAAVGEPCPSPPWAGFDLTRHYEYAFDAMGGRVWYVNGGVVQRDGQGRIIDRDTLAAIVLHLQ